MSNQYAKQDQNKFPALLGHSGTADTAETRRIVVDDYGGVKVGGTINSKPLATYIDGTQTTNVTYIGKAEAGAAATSPVWQIMKIDQAGGTLGDTVFTFADGNTNFDNLWTGRATATYS
jgi:hypothetical protein